MTKAIVIFRDRVSYVRQCVAALAAAGLDIHIVDHGSTWPAAVEWLATCGLPVHYRPNAHPRSLWEWDGLPGIVGTGRYVVTDPDVVADCPSDWLGLLNALLDRYPDRAKAGLGLRIDDLPEHYADAGKVRAWELKWRANRLEAGAYDAPVDTTLALYRPLVDQPHFALDPALRTPWPYEARHLTWYENTASPTDEAHYYRAHVTPGVSHWADPDLYMGVR